MNSKAIFIDIDGTLSPGKNYVSPKVIEAIRKVRSNHHYVFLCTGRNRIDIDDFVSIGFDGYICSGGGYIEVNGQVIGTSHNRLEDILYAIKILDENEVYYKLESDYMSFQDDVMLKIFNRYSDDDLEVFKKQHHIHPLSDYNKEDVQTVYCFSKPECLEILDHKLSPYFSFYTYKALPNGLCECELMSKDIDKGIALHIVLDYLNIDQQDSISFGDSINDLKMILAVNQGIVMDNGSDELKKHAYYICKSVNEDGIVDGMKELGLI